jgi:hypothetical protein
MPRCSSLLFAVPSANFTCHGEPARNSFAMTADYHINAKKASYGLN